MANLGYTAKPEEDAKEFKGSYEVIEPGWKKVVITGSKIEDNKSKTGKRLDFEYALQDGSGRTLTDRLNIVHENETAQRIGRATLGKIATAIGHKGELANTDPLHGRPFEIKISVEEFESNTEPGKMLKSNKVTDYRPVQAGTESTPKTASGW